MRAFFLLIAIGLALPSGVFAAGSLEPAALLDRARSVLLVEEEHGSTIVAKSPALELPIASLTKLMTALIFLDGRPSWNREMAILEDDTVGSGAHLLHAGDRVTVRNLFALMLVHSDNTAAMAVARSTGLSREAFVSAMNGKAEVMGLVHSHFVEPTGLDAGNRSTASDLIRLAAVAFQNKEIVAALERPTLTFPLVRAKGKGRATLAKRVATTNVLLGRTVGGVQILLGKTGTTDEAGYSYIVKAGTREKDPIHFLGVILATASQQDRFAVAVDVLRFGALQFLHTAPPSKPAPGVEIHTAMTR